MSDVNKPCSREGGFCLPMSNRIKGLGERGHGIFWVTLLNIKDGTTRTGGAKYIANSKDKNGTMLNFCPWCGASIMWLNEKE